jgi:hypothetical protein
MNTTNFRGVTTHSKLRRLLTSFVAATALSTGMVGLQATSSSATSRGTVTSNGVRLSPHTGDVDFTGEWTVTDPGNGDTATLSVDNQKSNGSFSGTVTPPANAPHLLAAPFPVQDGQVSGRHFSFTIERTGIGGTGATGRNGTYTANWDGTITGNTATGSIDAKTVPGTVLNPDGFAGARTFSAHRSSSVSASPGTGPAAGGVDVHVSGTGLDGATGADITDADGKVLATVAVNGASASGFTFTAPNLTAALHDADNAAVSGGNKPITQTAVEIVPHGAGGSVLSEPADYVVSAPIVGSVTPSDIAVGGGQSIVVKGSYFEGASAVDFQQVGSSTIISAPATVGSSHQLSFTTPDLQKFFAGSAAAKMTLDMYVRVNVAQAFGSLIYSNSTAFVVTNLRVDSVTPSDGPLVGGDKVRVDGVGFTNVTQLDMVAVGGKTPRTTTIAVNPTNDTSFSFTVPNDTAAASVGGSSNYDLVVIAIANGQHDTSAKSSSDRFDYKGPTVNSVSIAGTTVKADSGAQITLTGQYFEGVTKVVLKTFGGGATTVTPSAVSSTSVTFSLPNLTKDLKALGQKSAKFNVIVEIPVKGTTLSFVDSVSSNSNEFNVKS